LDPERFFCQLLKPIFECVPSQNGFSVEAPQRQSAIRFSAGICFHPRDQFHFAR